MSLKTQTISRGKSQNNFAKQFLTGTATFWFTVAVLGQWIFAFYVATFYGGAAMDGDFMKWNRVLPHGYVEGETMGNLAVALHLLFAVVVMVGGPLQFSSKIRNWAPSFHRWSGRIYVGSAFLISLSGMYMVLTKGTISGFIGDLSVSINGALILLFAFLAIKRAMQKDFNAHQKWVLRLFLAMGGVWFFRIGLMFWLLINNGPVGFDPETFRGPFLVFLGFGQYLIPLALAELYFYSTRTKTSGVKILTSMILLVCTVITAIGTFAATMGMWIPRIS
ncbi:DUF2306 domain-containing protein [Flagellimonas allohymeniacidonis]|uniref:DUF2306 domain-containing protein n=1 Tax=Flagellimonas allohymeniacidonis TaxID=2517819 RepID=A0A4Q8QIS1_9FLAO|nr:DUF2306 domain-containing protein [Allomuricauda hymeniacidonis]TAI49168.1 DUF2306 domain-containing protein [Allomuricauda hymeniacidonis]